MNKIRIAAASLMVLLAGVPAHSSAQVHDGWLGGFFGRYALGAELGYSLDVAAIVVRAEGLPADDNVFSGGVIVPAARGAVSAYGLQLVGGLNCSATSLSGSARNCVSQWIVVGSTGVGVDFEIGEVVSAFAEGGVLYGSGRSPQLVGAFGVRISVRQGDQNRGLTVRSDCPENPVGGACDG